LTGRFSLYSRPFERTPGDHNIQLRVENYYFILGEEDRILGVECGRKTMENLESTTIVNVFFLGTCFHIHIFKC
jgi:hypothetical protein